MWTSRSSFAVLLLASSALVAQSTKTVGVELQVNTYTPGRQASPAVDRDSDGDFVVVWESEGQDGASYGFFAQRFSSTGARKGTEFLVNSYTEEGQWRGSVGVDADGDFVVVWLSYESYASVVKARRYSSAGAAQGAEFQVNVSTGFMQYTDVDLEPDGDFAVVWSASPGGGIDVFARRFDSAGVAVGNELTVNEYLTGNQVRPRVGVAADGDFVVTWASDGQDGDSFGIFARRFTSSGSALAAEFQVNVLTAKRQYLGNLSVDAPGAFVVTWVTYEGVDTGMGIMDVAAGIVARRFDSAGSALGPEIQVKYLPGKNPTFPDVALRQSGDFLVVWQQSPVDFNEVAARHFDASGFPRGADFALSTHTTTGHERPRIAVDNDGEFVVVWQSLNQDGDFFGVFGRRLITLAELDVDGDGSTDPLTDGLLTLRYHFGFTGATLTTGAVSGNCSRCTPEAILAYLQSRE